MHDAISEGESFCREHVFRPAEVIAFALQAGDSNPLHHDAELAAKTQFGGMIVSATHTTALLLGLAASYFADRGTVVGVSFAVALKRAVLADARVKLVWTVQKARARPRGGSVVELEGSLTDESGAILVAATGILLVGVDLVGAWALDAA